MNTITVAELIEQLQQFDGSTKVVLTGDHDPSNGVNVGHVETVILDDGNVAAALWSRSTECYSINWPE